MRRMADSVTVANLPTVDLYAAYIDGRYANFQQVRARFPGKTVIAIAVSAADNEGDCLDVETFDATPSQAPGWVQRRRAAGHRGPLVYCSEAVWPSVRAAFSVQGIPAPGYWVAGYPGAEGDSIPQGAIGHQWIDHGGWDESCMVDYLPGIDPEPPNPFVQPTKEQIMQAVIVNGVPTVYAANPQGHLMEFTKTPAGWSVDDVTAEIAKSAPGAPPFLVQP
jgi:hypothetical protein